MSRVRMKTKPTEKQTKQQPVKKVPTKEKGKQPKFQNNAALWFLAPEKLDRKLAIPWTISVWCKVDPVSAVDFQTVAVYTKETLGEESVLQNVILISTKTPESTY